MYKSPEEPVEHIWVNFREVNELINILGDQLILPNTGGLREALETVQDALKGAVKRRKEDELEEYLLNVAERYDISKGTERRDLLREVYDRGKKGE